MGDLGAYLASIDWGLAIILAVGAIVVGLVMLRLLLAVADDLAVSLPGLGARLGRSALARRGPLPTDVWVCHVCRSVNPPLATTCYRGCGERPDRPIELPAEAGELARDATGRTLRRG